MELDLVHDIQHAYRKVLNSMARPGTIEKLEESEKINLEVGCYKSTFLTMLMLLDGEVSFNIISKNSDDICNLISQVTYSNVKEVEEADYIFVLEDSIDELCNIYGVAKFGTLNDPNKSATIIAEFNNIDNSEDLELYGPGIKDKTNISLNINNNWVETRALKNKEYPLGVDAIYLDKEFNVISLPRTTQIKVKEA